MGTAAKAPPPRAVEQGHVTDLECNEAASAELAVNAQIEDHEFANPLCHLKASSKCPDVPMRRSKATLISPGPQTYARRSAVGRHLASVISDRLATARRSRMGYLRGKWP